jgi:hypothetical protein
MLLVQFRIRWRIGIGGRLVSIRRGRSGLRRGARWLPELGLLRIRILAVGSEAHSHLLDSGLREGDTEP